VGEELLITGGRRHWIFPRNVSGKTTVHRMDHSPFHLVVVGRKRGMVDITRGTSHAVFEGESDARR